MGYRGKVAEQRRARTLRRAGWTLAEIAAELAVSRSSVSGWVADVPFDPAIRDRRSRRRRSAGMARRPGTNPLTARKRAEIEAGARWGAEMIGEVGQRDLLVAGTALYAGEGAKTDRSVRLANTDARMIELHCRWLRTFFDIDESRLRVRLYLHDGLDLAGAEEFWSQVTGIPLRQFQKAHRPPSPAGGAAVKHERGCPVVIYNCAWTHRAVMGLVDGLLGSHPIPG